MTAREFALSEVAGTMKAAFDEAFARPREEAPAEHAVDLLAIRIGEERFFVRLDEVAAVHAGRAVTRMPSTSVELAGVMSLRGEIVPVYDLGAVLGATTTDPSRRWLFVSARASVALCFDEFEGHVRAPPSDVASPAGMAGAASAVVRAGGELRPLLDLTQILEHIATRARPASPLEGRK